MMELFWTPEATQDRDEIYDYIEADNPAQVVGRGHYGKDFAAALAEGSKFAVQFHPEKSHTHGLQLLQNFIAWDGRW